MDRGALLATLGVELDMTKQIHNNHIKYYRIVMIYTLFNNHI